MPKRVSSDSTPSYADQPLAQRLRTSPPPGAAGVPGAPGAPAAAGAGGGSPPNAALSHMPGLRIRPGQPPVDLYAQGGPHGTTKAHSKRGEQESNHTPPQATYRGTPFEHLHPDNMPAISMAYSDHRNKKGGDRRCHVNWQQPRVEGASGRSPTAHDARPICRCNDLGSQRHQEHNSA